MRCEWRSSPDRRRAGHFPRAVIQGNNAGDWNTTPRSNPGPTTSRPATITPPSLASLVPWRSTSTVDLPQPRVADDADELAFADTQVKILDDDDTALLGVVAFAQLGEFQNAGIMGYHSFYFNEARWLAPAVASDGPRSTVFPATRILDGFAPRAVDSPARG